MLLPRKIGALTLMRKLGGDGVSEHYAGILDEPAGKQILARRIPEALMREPRRASELDKRLGDLAGIRHPALVPILDVVHAGSERFLVEEWQSQSSLAVVRDAVADGQELPPNVFLHLATQICNGLEALHGRPGRVSGEASVLHLHLRAEAISVDERGRIRVGGYGLTAKPTSFTAGDSAAAGIDLGCLSPEQTQPDGELGPPSDLFALGSLLYELLLGKRLFAGDSALSTIHRIRKAEVSAALSEVKQRLPGLDKVLFRALSLNPRHRYQRAFVLREDLRGLMAAYSFSDIELDTQRALQPRFGLPDALASDPGLPRMQTADFPYSGFSEDESEEVETEVRADLLDVPPVPVRERTEETDWDTAPGTPENTAPGTPENTATPEPESTASNTMWTRKDLLPPPAPVEPEPLPSPPDPPRPITGENTSWEEQKPDIENTSWEKRSPAPPPQSSVPEPVRQSPQPAIRRPAPQDDFDPNQEFTDPGSGRSGAALLGAGALLAAIVLICGGGGLTAVLWPAGPEATPVASAPEPEPEPVPEPVEEAPEPEEPPLRRVDEPTPVPRPVAAAPVPAPRPVIEPRPVVEPRPTAPSPIAARPAAPAPRTPSPAPRPAPVAVAPSPAPVPVIAAPQPMEELPEALQDGIADAAIDPVAFALDGPDSWSLASALSSRGELDSTQRMALASVPESSPEYTRARTLLYDNARAMGDSRERRAQLSALFALPENTYNPVYLIEDAELSIRSKDYTHALEQARRAERYWARIPSELIFAKKAMIYEAQARAHQGLFYDNPEELRHLTQAIDGWDRYRRHVESDKRADLIRYADEELAKLTDARGRLE